MNNRLNYLISVFLLSAISGSVLAQDYDYHPIISDNFNASLGYMRSSNSFRFESDRFDSIGDFIDFNDALNVSDSSSFFNGQIRWKFGSKRKWSIAGQYFSNDATGDAVLKKDITWSGVTFRKGSNVGAGVELAVTRLLIGRSFIKNDQHEFGVGVGVHNLDLSAYIEGEIIKDDETTEFQNFDVGENQPLPNVGAWYFFSPAKKWLVHARVDWISANVGDYDGGLWNGNIGVGYQVWDHVGFDLSWQYFNLNLEVDKSDWRGSTDMTYSGPVLSVIFTW